jgi:hypothetical protein
MSEKIVKKRGRPVKIRNHKENQTDLTAVAMANTEEKIDKIFDLMQGIKTEFQSLKDKQTEIRNDLMLAITNTSKEANSRIDSIEQEVNSRFENLTQSVVKDIETVHENLRSRIDNVSQSCNDNINGLGQDTCSKIDDIQGHCEAVEQRLIEVDQRAGADTVEINNKIEGITRQLQEFQQKVQEFEANMIGKERPSSSSTENSTSLPPCLVNESIPKFDGKQGSIPREFLTQLNEYFENHNIDGEYRLRVAMKSLEGGARIWGAANKSNIHNMGDFEQKLLQEYWNSSRKREYRNSVLGKRYDTEGAVSMTEFLATNYLKAKYIEPVMTEKEIIEEIRNLFPVNIKNALISGRADTFETASELLQMLRHDKPIQKPMYQSSYQPRGGSSESSGRGQGNYQPRSRPYQRGGPSNFVPRGRGVNFLRVEGEQSYRGGYNSRYRRNNYRQNQQYYNEGSVTPQGQNETQPKEFYNETAGAPAKPLPETPEVVDLDPQYDSSQSAAPQQAEN